VRGEVVQGNWRRREDLAKIEERKKKKLRKWKVKEEIK
jgi:hypothetical protein